MHRLTLREPDVTVANLAWPNIPAGEVFGCNNRELVKQDDRTVRVP
jgi:hypothetical protein